MASNRAFVGLIITSLPGLGKLNCPLTARRRLVIKPGRSGFQDTRGPAYFIYDGLKSFLDFQLTGRIIVLAFLAFKALKGGGNMWFLLAEFLQVLMW